MKCIHCHREIQPFEDAHETINGKFVCGECLELYYRCTECGKYFKKTSSNGVVVSDIHVCRNCLANTLLENGSQKYFRCSRCGNYFNSSELRTFHGVQLCTHCNDVSTETVCGYHSHHGQQITFFDAFPVSKSNRSSTKKLYMGVELEVESHGSTDRNDNCLAFKSFFPKDFFHTENDASLRCGFENISEPGTYEYHEWLEPNYRRAFSYLKHLHYTSHNGGTCGLHVHVNKNFFGNGETYDKALERLLTLIDSNWDNIKKFSRRSNNAISSWANRYSENPHDVVEASKLDYSCPSRYHCLNLNNDKTLEFRIFRGTLNVNTYIATLQFVHNICMIAKNVSSFPNIDAVTWEQIIGSKEQINTYWTQVEHRGEGNNNSHNEDSDNEETEQEA